MAHITSTAMLIRYVRFRTDGWSAIVYGYHHGPLWVVAVQLAVFTLAAIS